MLQIYVTSSARNTQRQKVIDLLREQKMADFQVFDYKRHTFSWVLVDSDFQEWGQERFVAELTHPDVVKAYEFNMDALIDCDACILVLPAGKSSHLEAGLAAGMSIKAKKLFILMEGDQALPQPELMYKMANKICLSKNELIDALKEFDSELAFKTFV